MNRATRAAAAALGIYAGVLAIIHGLFEIIQGSGVPTSPMVQAIGPACQPETAWHACLPALTLLPSFLMSGIATVTLGVVILVWSFVITRKFGSLGLVLLSIGLIPVGGGFVPPWLGILAGITATQIRRPPPAQSPNAMMRLSARFWPVSVLVLIAWFPLGWLLGAVLPDVMSTLASPLFLVFTVLLPLLTACSAVSYDGRQTRAVATVPG
jgi:hypothetical protein